MFGFSYLKDNTSQYKMCDNISQFAQVSLHNNICVNHMISKYEDDKVFFQDDDFIVVLDGVVLNKKQLIEEHRCVNWKDLILKLYKESDTFFDVFRGSFAGMIYDKQKDKTIVFSDHIGTKFLYYVKLDEGIFVTSMMPNAYKFLQENHIPYSLSEESAYLLLSYGYMLEDRTLCDKVKKLRPGCYLEITGTVVTEKRYCMLDNTPYESVTEAEAIELIDREFRKAVALEFEKDKEYGYKHLVALSAGLDSRMTCWVAHDMGYTDQLNITFSQSDYWDEIVPKQISSDLKHEWLFKALDNGLWLYDVDDVTKVTGGNVLYYGLAHGYSLYRKMNFKDYGMIHSGQLGDVVIGTFYSSKNANTPFKFGDGAYSRDYLHLVKNIELEQFANQEIAKFYHRGFCGTNNGQLVEMEYTETCSPFMNWDFMQAILKIPVELRYGHNIYKKWILSKYPGAAKYVWEKIGCKIDRKHGMINYKNHKVLIEDLPKKIFRRIYPCAQINKQNMNPIDYYLKNNKDLMDDIEHEIETCNINAIKSKELRDIIGVSNPKPIVCIQLLSLVSAINIFYTQEK